MSKILNKSNILFIVAGVLFTIPSIAYYINNGTILMFNKEFCFLLNNSNRIIQTIIYIIVLSVMVFAYYGLAKNERKIFKNVKHIFITIALVSLIFILVIPFWSSDVFYYLGIGRLESKYAQNPYYNTIREYVDENKKEVNLDKDTVMLQGYVNVWSDSTVVYGALWTKICEVIARLSMGNIDFGVLLFKFINAIIHILNCFFVYKITRKKIFLILYGFNPLLLIDGISNAHNDMFVIFFIFIAIYMLLKQKNILFTIIFLALATAIKYFAILLVPICIIYHFREKKISLRFLYGGIFVLIYFLLLVLIYLPYMNNINVLDGISMQQR